MVATSYTNDYDTYKYGCKEVSLTTVVSYKSLTLPMSNDEYVTHFF